MFFKGFNIVMPLMVREKIQFWVDKADKEVSGLGDAWIDIEAKTIFVSDAFLIEQECTATETEMDDEAISKAVYKAHVDETNGIKRNLKFWWHSHVNMGVFWSGTDVDTMKKLSEHGWFCNIVFNKKREMLGAMSYPQTIEAMGEKVTTVQIDDKIPIQLQCPFDEDYKKELEKQFDENYKEKTYTTYGTSYNSAAYQRGDISESGREVLWANSYIVFTSCFDDSTIYVEYVYMKDRVFAYFESPDDVSRHTYRDMPYYMLVELQKEIEGMDQHKALFNFLEEQAEVRMEELIEKEEKKKKPIGILPSVINPNAIDGQGEFDEDYFLN